MKKKAGAPRKTKNSAADSRRDKQDKHMRETWQRHNPDGNPDGNTPRAGAGRRATLLLLSLRLSLRLRPPRRMAISCYSSFAGVVRMCAKLQ
jgi:hypothetical protein